MDQLLAYAQETSQEASGPSLFWYIVMAVGLYKMFEKAGIEGWAGFVPFYNQYKLCEAVMGNPWYWLRKIVIVVPVIGWIAYLYFSFQIGKATAKAYGQSDTWAWGYLFLEPVFFCITGFSKQYSYYGPYGAGDTRTGSARQAKTVDFDVVKNRPQPKAEPVKEPTGDDVEFDFHQDNIVE